MRRALFASVAVIALAACDNQTAGRTAGDSGSTTTVADTRSGGESSNRRARAARDTTSVEAVQGLYLAESGSGRVSFESADTVGGEHVLTNVLIAGEEGDSEVIRAERIRLLGAHMDGGAASFDRLIFENLTVESDTDEGSVTVASISIDEPNAKMADLVSTFLSNEDVDDDYDFGQFTDYAFGAFTIDGVNIDVEEDGEPVRVDIGRMGLEDMSAGRLGKMVISDIAFEGRGDDGEVVTGSLDSWTFNGLDASALDVFAELGDDPSDAAFHQALTESGLTNPFAKHYDSYALRGLNFDVDGLIFSIGGAEGSAKQTRGGVETSSTLTAMKFRVDDAKSMGAQAKQGLEMLGYDEIEIDGEAVYMADELNDRIYTREARLTLKDGFTLEADYDIGGIGEYTKRATELGGVDIDSFSGGDFDMAEIADIYEPLIINKFELRLIDDSIVERGFNVASTMTGMTPEQVREQAGAMLTMGGMFVPEGAAQQIALDAIAATREFLANPGTLSISVDSDQPVAIGDLIGVEDPNELATIMPIKVEASK